MHIQDYAAPTSRCFLAIENYSPVNFANRILYVSDVPSLSRAAMLLRRRLRTFPTTLPAAAPSTTTLLHDEIPCAGAAPRSMPQWGRMRPSFSGDAMMIRASPFKPSSVPPTCCRRLSTFNTGAEVRKTAGATAISEQKLRSRRSNTCMIEVEDSACWPDRDRDAGAVLRRRASSVLPSWGWRSVAGRRRTAGGDQRLGSHRDISSKKIY